MPPLPVISGRQCVRALERLGYRVVRQRGSHLRLHHDERPPITIPDHPTLDRGTLRSILRAASVDPEELLRLL
jgi:predicted RNA binding protein YcfA (HicA-like mRNA interferase family)